MKGVKVGSQAKQKKTKAEERAESKVQAALMSGLLQIFLNGVFGAIAITRREAHWQLSKLESDALAKQLTDCLETLPKGTYDQIQKLVERYIPWVGLVITGAAITGPRIEQSRAAANREAGTPFTGGTRSDGSGWQRGFANPYQYGGQSGPESGQQFDGRGN